MEEEFNWYIVNFNNKLKDTIISDLKERISSLNLEEFFKEFKIIIKKEINAKSKKFMERNIYPGYLFILMKMNNDSWHVVRHTPGIIGFLGTTGKKAQPIPISFSEAEKMLEKYEEYETKNYEKTINFDVNDIVYIKDPSLGIDHGKVLEINLEKELVTVEIEVFGRLTPWVIPLKNVSKR
ncbi:hypothetical protein JTY60_00835 [symbiont of Argiope bruennichi]|uniref:transcription termination/antitermination protein NusG n=1 Tax=symbiont of Argiope bruennichi TaxID=2810479 RepID=UPI003DA1DF9C